MHIQSKYAHAWWHEAARNPRRCAPRAVSCNPQLETQQADCDVSYRASLAEYVGACSLWGNVRSTITIKASSSRGVKSRAGIVGMCEKTGKIVHLANVPIEEGWADFGCPKMSYVLSGYSGGGLA